MGTLVYNHIWEIHKFYSQLKETQFTPGKF